MFLAWKARKWYEGCLQRSKSRRSSWRLRSSASRSWRRSCPWYRQTERLSSDVITHQRSIKPLPSLFLVAIFPSDAPFTPTVSCALQCVWRSRHHLTHSIYSVFYKNISYLPVRNEEIILEIFTPSTRTVFVYIQYTCTRTTCTSTNMYVS